MASSGYDSCLYLLDTELITATQRKFRIDGYEAFRLEATFAQCSTRMEAARSLVGPKWDEMTRSLLRKGLIEMPEKGPAVVTPKAARFLAICGTPIVKN